MSENKEQQVHKFKASIELLQPLSAIGDAAVQLGYHSLVESDEMFYSGVYKAKQVVVPAMDILAITGARELTKAIQREFNETALAGNRIYDLVHAGKLSVMDLREPMDLSEKLKSMGGLHRLTIAQIMKYRDTAYDFLLFQQGVLSNEKIQEYLTPKMREHIASKDFFSLGRKNTNDLLKAYIKASDNDVLKNIRVTSLSKKDIAKLIKTRNKNGLTDQEVSALRLLAKQMRYRESRIHVGRLLNVKRRIELASSYAYKGDGNANSGVQTVATTIQISRAVFSVARFGLRAGVVSASFAGKYTGVSYLLAKLNHVQKVKTEQLAQKAKEAIKSTEAYQKVEDTKKAVKEGIEKNRGVQKYKELQKKASGKAKVIGKKKRQVMRAARSTGRHLKRGKDIVFAPLHLVGKMISGLRTVFMKFKLTILGALAIVAAVVLILVLLVNALLSVFQTETEAALTMILVEDETYVSTMVSVLLEKEEERLEAARDMVDGEPQNNVVNDGHTISGYGYVGSDGTLVNDSTIQYVNSEGEVVPYGTNTIKDAIAIAYVITGGDFDGAPDAAEALISDLWELMHPEITYEESDIFLCPDGCETETYACEDVDCDCETGEHTESVCYGHKIITVSLPVLSVDDITNGNIIPAGSGKLYQSYVNSFEGWTEDTIEWVNLLLSGDWMTLYHVNP